MKSELVRKKFLEFFASKHHEIVSSAPMVIKDDPTLMFTNAGMNQFKEFFLGNNNSKNFPHPDINGIFLDKLYSGFRPPNLLNIYLYVFV